MATSNTIMLLPSNYNSLGAGLEIVAGAEWARLENADGVRAWWSFNNIGDPSADFALGYERGYFLGAATCGAGALVCNNVGGMRASAGINIQQSLCTISGYFTTGFNGAPGATEAIIESYTAGLNTGRIIVRIAGVTGDFQVYFYKEDGTGFAISATATALAFNDGLTWDSTEECFWAICVDLSEGITGTARLYGGRVSGGTANLLDTDPDILGISESDAGIGFEFGGTGAQYFLGDLGEMAIYDDVLSTAASFAIPAKRTEVFSTASPVWQSNEVDMTNVASITAADSLDDPDGFGGTGEYRVSNAPTGAPSWSAWMNAAAFEAALVALANMQFLTVERRFISAGTTSATWGGVSMDVTYKGTVPAGQIYTPAIPRRIFFPGG